MGLVLVTAEVVAGICLSLVAAFLLVTFLRRRALSLRGEVIICSLRGMGTDRWRPGLLRRTDSTLEWYPMFGMTTRPSFRWDRQSLRLGVLSEPSQAADVACDQANRGLFPGEPVLVPVSVPGGDGQEMRGELALAPGPYMAVRAWVEAAPPGDRPY